MLLEDHKRRVARLLRGERKVTDLERLFADLRMMKPGRASVREVGHFAAHRNERDSGVSLDRANDIETSTRLWHQQIDGIRPSIDDLREAARANLNIITDERLQQHLGITRQTAQQSFAKGIRKYDAGKPLKERELQVMKVLGLSMMWQYLFDDRTLSTDFVDLLILDGSLAPADRAQFESVAQFITLYALSIMHGARLRMRNGSMAQLRLAASAETGMLRVKADIPISRRNKPTSSSVPLFETTLDARAHCDPKVLTFLEEAVPVEIEGDRLVAIA